MSDILIDGRFKSKHDTEANWNKATNFYPLEGEIIVYEPDSTHPYPRFKVGIWDGKSTKTSAMLVTNLPFSHPTFSAASAAIRAIGRDTDGHVVLGDPIIAQSAGGSEHTHAVTVNVPANKFLTGTGSTSKKLSLNLGVNDDVVVGVTPAQGNLEVTSITGVSGSTTASKATAGTAVAVATTDTAVRYGTANVGTEVKGLAKRAASTTNVGNANVAVQATTVGNANVGSATRYGTANVGSATRYGTANVGSTQTVAVKATEATVIGNANINASPTTVGNADVGSATVYGKANVGSATVYGKANVGTATRYGTANVGTATKYGTANVGASFNYGKADVGSQSTVTKFATNGSAFLVGQADPDASAHTVITSLNGTAYSATVTDETLVLTALAPGDVTIRGCSTTSRKLGDALSNQTVTSAKAAATSQIAYSAVEAPDTQTLTPAVAAPSTQTLTPAVAAPSTQTLTPAVAAPSSQTLTPAKSATKTIYGVTASENYIYGVGGEVDVTSAVAAPSSQTLTPAVAAPSTQTLTPAVQSTTSIRGAVASETYIYGVTADQVNILPAVEAPSSQTLIPAKANGTITPYSFSNVTVPKAATATTVATGQISAGGGGDTVATGIASLSTASVLSSASIQAGDSGDVTVVTAVSQTKNTATTLSGASDQHTCPAHTHTLVASDET